jgi:uncharacterized membrane protein
MAFFSVVLFGCAAVGVDGAHFFLVKRHQQAATDMAAIAAAASLETAPDTAGAVMTANGFGTASLQVTPGVYTADPLLAAGSRFGGSGTPNAVQVTSTTNEPFIFGGALRAVIGASDGSDGFPIRTVAVARKQDQAAFTLGSGLASLDQGVLNAILGGLLGTRLSLSLLDYQSLAGASVDLFGFSDALATRVGVEGSTYGALASATVSPSALLGILATTTSGGAQATSALRALAAAGGSAGSGPLGRLIDFGPSSSLAIGAPHPLSARVSALDMVRAVALLGGNGHAVSLDFGATLPGLGQTQVLMDVGEPAVGSGFFAIGPEGTTLHTAQVRLLLTTQVGGTGLPASLTVPFYLEVAPATATVKAISCTGGAANASVTLGVTTGIAGAVIGDVSASDFANLAARPSIGPATLLTVAGLLRVTAKVQPATAPAGTIAVPFSAADIRSVTPKTVSSGLSLATLAGSLVGNTPITVTLLGVGVSPLGLPGAVTAALNAALTPVDALLANTLSLLGVSVGTATTTVSGVRCGQGLLVN